MRRDGLSLKKRLALNLFGIKKKIESRLHELTYLFWECTLRCNLNCVHCGSDCQKEASVPDMPLKDFLGVIDSIKDQVNPHKTLVVLTGGEPLVRKDIEEFGIELYNRGFPWGMVTNGYAMTLERFKNLLNSGLRSITISLDGLEDSHDWFRGRRGSFKRALRAIRIVAATENLVNDVVTCVTQKNFNELEKIKKLLIDTGLKKWRLLTVFPKGRAAHNKDLKLSNEQFRDLLNFIRDTRIENKIRANYGCEGFLAGYEGEVRDNFFTCAAGINIGSVLIDGSISACPSLRADYIQGNIYKDDFMECWNNRFQIMRNRKWTKTGKCATCKVYKWCNGNGLHLRDEKTGELLMCHYEKIMNQTEDPAIEPEPDLVEAAYSS